ncbi:MAG: flippase [Actinomycetota bacterium]
MENRATEDASPGGTSAVDLDTEVDDLPAGRSLGENVSSLFAAQIITWIIAVALVVLVPRFLGATAIGQLQIAESVWAIAAVFAGLGTETVVTLDIARDRRRGAQVIAPVLLARALFFIVAAGAVAVVAATLYDSDLALLFVIVGCGMVFAGTAEVGVAALQGFEDLAVQSRANIVSKAVSAVAVLIALFAGAEIETIAIIVGATAGLYTLLLFRYVRRYARIEWHATVREAMTVARRGLPYLFGGATMVVYTQIDSIVISLLIDSEQVGWYAAADRLMATSLFVPTALMTALFPVLARLHNEDREAAERILDDGFRSLLVLALPIGVGIIVIARPFTRFLYGDDFIESGPVFAVFGVVLAIMFQTILLGQYAVATGREKFFFGLLAAVTVLSVPLDLVLVPWTNDQFGNGAIGGALAYVVTEGIVLVVAVKVMAPNVVNGAMFIRLLKCGVAAGVMAAAIWPLRSIFVLVPIGVGAAVYLIGIVVLRTLDERETEAVGALVDRVRRRGGDDEWTDDGSTDDGSTDDEQPRVDHHDTGDVPGGGATSTTTTTSATSAADESGGATGDSDRSGFPPPWPPPTSH